VARVADLARLQVDTLEHQALIPIEGLAGGDGICGDEGRRRSG